MRLTQQDIAFLAPGGKEEVFPFNRWSTKSIAPNTAVSSSYTFFQDIRTTAGQTQWWTNMRDPGKLERPYRAVFKALYFIVIPSLPDNVVTTAAVVTDTLEASKRLHEMFWWNAKLIDKDYTELTGEMIPSGGGVSGFIGSGATNTIVGAATWGVPAITNFAPVTLILPTQVGFEITAYNNFPVAYTTPNNGVTFYMKVVLSGYATRSEQ